MSFSNHSSDRDMVGDGGNSAPHKIHNDAEQHVAKCHGGPLDRADRVGGAHGLLVDEFHVEIHGDIMHSRRDVQDSV